MFNISVKEKEIPIFDNPLKTLSRDNKITRDEILNNLLNGKKNLELKTHIFKPKALAGLKSIEVYLNTHGYVKSAEIIKKFIRTYLKYMVSYKRLSRTEIIKALTYSNRIENKDVNFNSDLN